MSKSKTDLNREIQDGVNDWEYKKKSQKKEFSF